MAVGQPDSASLGRGGGRLSRYDLVLAVLPVAFAVAAAAGHLSAVPLQLALACASLFGGVLVADALFVNPPVER